MSYHKMEMFGHIVYSPDLSYHDLLSREEEAKLMVQAALERAGGEYIHFEALGDTLRFQCLLPEERDAVFHGICDGLAPYAANGLDARLLFVDRDLDSLYIYSLSGGKWQECAVAMPPAGTLMTKAEPVTIREVLPVKSPAPRDAPKKGGKAH